MHLQLINYLFQSDSRWLQQPPDPKMDQIEDNSVNLTDFELKFAVVVADTNPEHIF